MTDLERVREYLDRWGEPRIREAFDAHLKEDAARDKASAERAEIMSARGAELTRLREALERIEAMLQAPSQVDGFMAEMHRIARNALKETND